MDSHSFVMADSRFVHTWRMPQRLGDATWTSLQSTSLGHERLARRAAPLAPAHPLLEGLVEMAGSDETRWQKRGY